jgi:UDP-N-acetylglucosamine--N-acetylmuramyl-(pentapeptide) pyrophosphoryl-undecaprenol N-acetylglucosamine transferase
MRKIKIVFTGGGTGGHLFPIIAVAREITRISDQPVKLHYIGPGDKTSAALLSQETIKIHRIINGKLRRYFSLRNIIDIFFSIPIGFLQSFFLLLFIRPRLVFSKGGSGSTVVCACAGLLGIPIFIHESDSVPGLSNKITSRWAKKIFISFPKTEYFNLTSETSKKGPQTLLVGHPILKELLEGNNESAKEIFNVTLLRPILLFWGGSQGAEPINDFVLEILHQLLRDYEIIHVCGKKNYQQVRAESLVITTKETESYYHLWEFLHEIELKHALKVADVIISRGGAGSIFEIAATGKPSIIIPLPSSAGNHQSKNAYQYAKTGAGLVMEQDNLSPNLFLARIQYILSHSQESQAMKAAALEFSKPLAAKAIAREILEFLQ